MEKMSSKRIKIWHITVSMLLFTVLIIIIERKSLNDSTLSEYKDCLTELDKDAFMTASLPINVSFCSMWKNRSYAA